MNAEIFVGEQYAGAWKPGDVASDVSVLNNTVTSQNAQGRGVVLGYGVARTTVGSNHFSGCGGTVACAYPKKPIIRIEEVGTDTLNVTNNRQDTAYDLSYIYLGQVGPYKVVGNDMAVHQ